ncbi:MAG: MFS transporter, partial [Clostridia bacterium]|nr:MFS transporter [Clostridia bacterium]
NFCTQLIIDLIFSFFSHKFNIPATVKFTPVITFLGLLIYALAPVIFPQNVYLGLALGTVVFSVSGGLSEVLISPVIAAIPAKDPDREMSKLHSVYAWGVVFVIIVSTVFILLFKGESWQVLALLFMLVPLVSSLLFAGSEIPPMETPEKATGALHLLGNRGVWLCVFAIFLGGAAECTMAQWASGYIEGALGIDKFWGDICGAALFSVMLGLGRTLYGKFGKNIGKVLFLGALGASVCYVTAAFSDIAVLGLLACAFTGFCVSMLWPGNLIVASERFPAGGVFIYAMMAAGGDLGASVGPQLIGIITDGVAANADLAAFAESLALSPEQLGMKAGMLAAALFPLAGVFIYKKLCKKTK